MITKLLRNTVADARLDLVDLRYQRHDVDSDFQSVLLELAIARKELWVKILEAILGDDDE